MHRRADRSRCITWLQRFLPANRGSRRARSKKGLGELHGFRHPLASLAPSLVCLAAQPEIRSPLLSSIGCPSVLLAAWLSHAACFAAADSVIVRLAASVNCTRRCSARRCWRSGGAGAGAVCGCCQRWCGSCCCRCSGRGRLPSLARIRRPPGRSSRTLDALDARPSAALRPRRPAPSTQHPSPHLPSSIIVTRRSVLPNARRESITLPR